LKISVLPDVVAPPLYLAAIGPKMLHLAATQFDGVILHPFLTPEAVTRSIQLVNEARVSVASPQPPFRIFAAVIVAPDGEEQAQLHSVSVRASRYFMARTVRESLVSVNNWDSAQVPRQFGSGSRAERRELESLPVPWLQNASAIGSVSERAAKLAEYLTAGADELILHGATIHELPNVVQSLSNGS
jgi:alkanesulfonate monooxygenase SsuD/methylene tetrahydromethanopterin reductase-like flavin-dependent oxidoreductase (luciferase family)